MKVDSMPVHEQSVEQCVLDVTATSKAVFGYAGRDDVIRSRLAHKGS